MVRKKHLKIFFNINKMTSYSPFYRSIWGDKKFKRLSLEARLLFIYLFANESIGLTGIYELDIEICKLRTNLTMFDNALKEVIDFKMVEYDEESGFIWVVNFFKLIPTKSPKVLMGAIKEINKLGDNAHRNNFLNKYKDYFREYPYMFSYEQKQNQEIHYMQDDNFIKLMKIYSDKKSIKKFLLNRGCKENEIDDMIKRHFKDNV